MSENIQSEVNAQDVDRSGTSDTYPEEISSYTITDAKSVLVEEPDLSELLEKPKSMNMDEYRNHLA